LFDLRLTRRRICLQGYGEFPPGLVQDSGLLTTDHAGLFKKTTPLEEWSATLKGEALPLHRIEFAMSELPDFDLLEIEYTRPFEQRLDRLGEDVRVLWGSGKFYQTGAFVDICNIGDLNGKTVLDIGCGFSDLIDFLGQQHIKIKGYYGIDLSRRMVEIARRRHPGFQFEQRNIRTNPLPEDSVDYAIGSGIMFLRNPHWQQYAKEVVGSMFQAARIGVAVNFLLSDGNTDDPELNFTTPDRVLRILRSVSDKLSVVENRRIEHFTVYLYKPKKRGAQALYGSLG